VTGPRAPAASRDLSGTRLGGYEIRARLGAGGMGDVYRAQDSRLEREVALKVLPEDLFEDKERRRRFEQEAKLLAALNHPNIAAVYSFEEAEGRHLLAMELVEGKTLREALAAGPLSSKNLLDLSCQVSRGLAQAHEAGIVHRDLKPENIMVSKDGFLKILDFGLAKRLPSERGAPVSGATVTALTEAGLVVGTAGYMSPEQAGGGAVDFRSDQFSFGSILYEMATGVRAFQRKTSVETLAAILNEEPKPVAEINPAAPPPLRWVIERCLAKDPAARYASTQDLAQELRTVRDHLAEVSGTSAAAFAAAAPRRRIAVLMGIAAAILLALGWLAWRFRRTDARRENPLAGARFTRLTDWDGSEVDAAISADAKFVAFLADREEGLFDVWVGQVGGTGFVNLTHGRFPGLFNTRVRNVGFTPDGTHIWVHVTTKDLADHRIWLIPTLGGEPRPFVPNAVSVAWSPDGKRLVYHEPTNGDPIFLAEASGAGVVKRFQDKLGIHWHDPVWGSDGRSLFFSSGLPPENMDLWRLPVAKGPPERMTKHTAGVRYPTPLDARTIVYCANGEEGSGSALYALDVDSRITRRVSFGLEQYLSIAAAADGMRLVAAVANPDRNLWTVPVTEGVVDEGSAARLPLSTVRAIRPRWNRDSLLFLSYKGGSDRLFRSRGRELSELWNPVGGSISGAPAVSPDGASICFPVRRDGRTQLQVLAADGTNPRTLGPSLDLLDSAAWSADSKWIAVAARDETGFGLFRVPVNGDAVVRLVAGIVWNPVWSPDGRFIVYSETLPGSIRRLRAVTAAGIPHPVPELTVVFTGDRYRFLNDSRRLVVLKGPFRNQDFWLVDLETGRERRLTNLKPGYEPKSFDVSPDSRQIVFDRVRENSDIVLIDRVRR
jgi:Tol biopolymer transport system component/predicted Ser/Thr protein kinase